MDEFGAIILAFSFVCAMSYGSFFVIRSVIYTLI
jgi:hypothetical protein